jgi:hypothetical protein
MAYVHPVLQVASIENLVVRTLLDQHTTVSNTYRIDDNYEYVESWTRAVLF